MTTPIIKKGNVLYPELSYSIVGCAYDVFNELGPGHSEKIYQSALRELFITKKVQFKEQVYYAVKFRDKVIGKSFFDFFVDEKIILEIKKDVRYSKIHLEQVLNYLKVSELKLAILVNFTNSGVTFKRIINISETIH